MKEHIIYQTMGFDDRTEEELEKEYREAMGIDSEETVKDTDVYEFHAQNASEWFSDERDNLDVSVGENILAIAYVGLWNGTRKGYKELSYKLHNIFNVWDSCDEIKLYCDRYDVRGVGIHHDGRNTVLFRRWKDNVSDANKERVMNALYYNKDNADALVKRYTRSICSDVKKVYGW